MINERERMKRKLSEKFSKNDLLHGLWLLLILLLLLLLLLICILVHDEETKTQQELIELMSLLPNDAWCWVERERNKRKALSSEAMLADEDVN